MTKVFALLALALAPTLAFAQSVKTDFSTKNNGVLRFALIGKDLCDSQNFSVRVIDPSKQTNELYASKSGATTWAINNNCGFNQEFSHSLLKPGVILKVVTSNAGVPNRAMWAAVPCYRTVEESQIRSLNFSLTEITTAISCDNNNYRKEIGTTTIATTPSVVIITKPAAQPAPQAPAPQAPAPNNCELSKQVTDQLVNVKATCARSEVADILITSNNQILCRSHVILGNDQTGSQSLCVISRNASSTMNLQVEMRGQTTNQTQSMRIAKNPTFSSPPTGRILTPMIQAVAKQSKALGRGSYWDASVSALVIDRDSDNGDVVIRTQLIEVTANGERVLDEQSTSSGGKVVYNLEHQFITPLLFGSDHHTGPLTVGQSNVLKIRVYDAYSKTSYVDLAAMTLNLDN